MKKMVDAYIERRKYVRLPISVKVSFNLPKTSDLIIATTKNISADGLQFEHINRNINEFDILKIKMSIPTTIEPVSLQGKIIWKRKVSLEDSAPYDYGLEILSIDENDKNTILKFLCDNIYEMKKEIKSAKN